MQKGFVYILTNPSYKDNIIKIGFTTNLKDRLAQLDKTGVPTPFDPYMTVQTAKYKELEKVIHHELDKLTDFRTRENREFFEIDPVDAADLLKNLARLLDDAEIVEYGNLSSVEEKSEATIAQQGNRTTFKMLGVPVGSKLVATNKNIPDVTVLDEINQVRLPDGSIKSISRAVIDAVGGHRNGFQVYKFNGKILSNIRKSFDQNYLPKSTRS
ncbi:GIY-YIG nuclease family protein [Candidatus Saccharibacteria bacterium]|nr:MAG: GIY-YIG nuclease family protein [Candidatus Saccharibacteria bacterium]